MSETSSIEYTSSESSPDHLCYKSCHPLNFTSDSDFSSDKEPIEGSKELRISTPNSLRSFRDVQSISSPFSHEHQTATHVYSEHVQTIAPQIYNELQRIMSHFTPAESVQAFAGLMPLIADVLESLDLSIIDNQRFRVELDLCKEDNEQLVAAIESEKKSKNKLEHRLLEIEYQAEEEKHNLNHKIASLEITLRDLDQKAKNSLDTSSRLEEKDEKMKLEYNKLTAKYTDLFQSHSDLVEKVKIVLGLGDFADANASGPPSFLSESTALRNFISQKLAIDDMQDESEEKNQQTKTLAVYPLSLSGPRLNCNDTEASLDAGENALNKTPKTRDLMDQVDALECQLNSTANENEQLTAVNDCLKKKNNQLMEEIEKLKFAIEECKMKEKGDKEEPIVQPEPSTHIELARVMKERDECKDKLIQLQETFRWPERIRTPERESAKEKSTIWILICCPVVVVFALIGLVWFLPMSETSDCFRPLLSSPFLSRNGAFRPPI